MWIRKRLDVSWRDMFYGIAQCFLPGSRSSVLENIKNIWPQPDRTSVSYSVRTGLDTLLGILNLPEGSEVLMSALTIPDMWKIILEHKLVPIPVELNTSDMGINVDDLKSKVTDKSRVLIVTHLFGGHLDIAETAQIAKETGLYIIEDFAQAFNGEFTQKHPDSDAAMFSFGTIKTATAFGGAVFVFNDSHSAIEFDNVTAGLTFQSRFYFLKKLVKYSVLKSMTYRFPFALFVRLCSLCRKDYDFLLQKWSKGFPGEGFFKQIRKQPCIPLLKLLQRRLCTYKPESLAGRAEKGRELVAMLSSRYSFPGIQAHEHVFWVFPVVLESPEHIIQQLREKGFDATRRASLQIVPAPSDRPEYSPEQTETMYNSITYLPFNSEMSLKDIRKMGTVLLGGN